MLTFCKRNVKEGAKKRVENLHVLRHSFGPVVCFIAYNAAVFIQSLGVCFVI